MPKGKKVPAGDCSLGHAGWSTKQAAEQANPGVKVMRCGRCRRWVAQRGRGRRR